MIILIIPIIVLFCCLVIIIKDLMIRCDNLKKRAEIIEANLPKPVLNIGKLSSKYNIRRIEMDNVMKFLEALSDELETNGVLCGDIVITDLKSLCSYLENKTGEIYGIE